MLNAKILFKEHAVLLNCKIKILVISDIHLGYEVELIKKGVNVPERAPILAEEIVNLGKKTNTKILYILGDVKHKIATASNFDLYQITLFFEKIKKWFNEVNVTLGNHDGGLKKLLPSSVNLTGSRGTIIKCDNEKISLFHGHAFPQPDSIHSKYIITGHGHYLIELKDTIGLKFTEPIWIVGEINRKKFSKNYQKNKESIPKENIKFIVIPPFNRIVGGISIDKAVENSIILKYMIKKNTKLFLEDGTYLTTFSNLIKFNPTK
ncbi:MAG: metallophosphoesterase [Nitrososphaeria archaeon]|nr:metallophosphoesterase [Nitrososphaeria archaeon]